MYKSIISKYIIPHLGSVKLKDLRSASVQALINEVIENGNIRTAQKIKVTIKQIIDKAIENNLLNRNPMVAIELPAYSSEKRALTDEEKQIVVKADLTIKERAFLYVMLYAGLRKGEALALTMSDIDLKAKTITVSKSVIAIGNKPETKEPKSKAGNRTIPMPDILYNAMKEHLSKSKYFIVFPSEHEEIMSHSAFRNFWRKIIAKLENAIGVDETSSINPILSPDITPHIFRHTFATTLYYAGVDIKTCQYLMGHSSIRMTMEIYTHLDVAKNVSAADKINSLLSSQLVVSTESK